MGGNRETIGAAVISMLTLGSLAALLPLLTGLRCIAVATGRRFWFS